MKRFQVLTFIMLVCSAAAPAADGEGFSSQAPAVRDIPPVLDGDPYYGCASYGYQLSKGACAPGWPPPAEGWTGGASGGAGGEASWRPERAHPSPYPGGFLGVPTAPAVPIDSSPWPAETAYPWAPAYMEWGRGVIPDGPGARWDGSPWDEAAPGWGRAGQGIDAPSSTYRPEGGRRGSAAGGRGQGRGDAADPFRGGILPWDPWLQDAPGNGRDVPQDPEAAAADLPGAGAPQPMAPVPLDEGGSAGPGEPPHEATPEEPSGDEAAPEPAGVWDPRP